MLYSRQRNAEQPEALESAGNECSLIFYTEPSRGLEMSTTLYYDSERYTSRLRYVGREVSTYLTRAIGLPDKRQRHPMGFRAESGDVHLHPPVVVVVVQCRIAIPPGVMMGSHIRGYMDYNVP